MSDRQHAPSPDGSATEAERPSGDAAESDGAAESAQTLTPPTVDDEAMPTEDAPSEDAPTEDATTEGTGRVAPAPEDPRSPEELRVELAEAEARRDEYLDDVRRARAEFENYRRRTTREAGVAREHGRADVAGALLDVLDDLDRTLEAAEGSSDEALAKAVDLVTDKLRRTLVGQGLERIDATEVPFDPEVHEAVQQIEAEEPTDQPQVHQVLRPGYRLGDRTLRAAMVVVAG